MHAAFQGPSNMYFVDNFRRFWIDQEFCALLRPQSQTAYWKLELVVATVLEWQLPTLGVCHVKPPRVIDPRVEIPVLDSTTLPEVHHDSPVNIDVYTYALSRNGCCLHHDNHMVAKCSE